MVPPSSSACFLRPLGSGEASRIKYRRRRVNDNRRESTPRRVARCSFDPTSGGVLLLQYQDGGRHWWAAPGGALEGDETFEEAAIREATEELAISSRSSHRRASKHIRAGVRREVWQRDAGQCAFVGANGRCADRGFLEFHHVVPYAEGGEAVAANLELRCRAHNAYEAERWFGPLVVREDGARMRCRNSVRTESPVLDNRVADAIHPRWCLALLRVGPPRYVRHSQRCLLHLARSQATV